MKPENLNRRKRTCHQPRHFASIQELEEKIAEKKQAREARFAEKRSRGKKSKKPVGFFGGIANFIASLFGKKPKKSKGRPRNRRYSRGKTDAHIQNRNR